MPNLLYICKQFPMILRLVGSLVIEIEAFYGWGKIQISFMTGRQ